MLTKVLATVLFLTYPDTAEYIIFTVYTTIAISSAFVIATLSDLDESGTWDFNIATITSNAGAAARFVISQYKSSHLFSQ